MITAVASEALWILGSVLVGLLFSFGIYHLVHRQSMVDTLREEVEQTAVVTPRTSWARAAATLDALWTVFILVMLSTVIADRSPGGLENPSGASFLASVALGAFAMWMTEAIHRRAARVEVVQSRSAA